MSEVTKLGAQHVDSFQSTTTTGSKCAMKGCTRAGRIRLFYTLTPGKQERAYICMIHALDFANEVLQKYKFKQ